MSLPTARSDDVSPQTAALAAHIAGIATVDIPADVRERARLHVLDTLAAVVSGRKLAAGRAARTWCQAEELWSGARLATVIGAGMRTSTMAAAFANGMAAHADETDDSHAESLSHPGCSIVPAALAVAEATGASGDLFLRAVIAGYDSGCRVGRLLAVKKAEMRLGRPSSHALVGVFGAASAVAVIHRLGADSVRHALSYAAQSAGGVTSWMRDQHHVEKAFVFAGMPSARGVLVAEMVASGCDGVADVFTGTPNWPAAMSAQGDMSWLAWELGLEWEVARTTLKKYSVGSPIQAAIEAVVELIGDGLDASSVRQIEIRIPADAAPVVDGKPIPSINAQYLVTGTLLDGRFSFAMAHDAERMRSTAVIDLLARTVLIHDGDLAGTRSAAVTLDVSSAGGMHRRQKRVDDVRGRPTQPMSRSEVRDKALDLMSESLGQAAAERVCDTILDVDSLDDCRRLGELLG